MVTFCRPPADWVEGTVLRRVEGPCVDGVWVEKTEEGGLESRKVVFWSEWHTLGSWDSKRGAEKVPLDPAAGVHTVSAALEGRPIG